MNVASRRAGADADSPAARGWRPSRADLAAAVHRTVPDVIAPNLRVLFCGINPGLYTAAIGHHFGRPGNRFWPVLHEAGFTPRRFAPWEEQALLPLGYGITNVVARTTATAAELGDAEIRAGGEVLAAKVAQHAPRVLAVLGIGAYRTAFGIRQARVGPQTHVLGTTQVWVLPNPSGLNANYQREDLVALFRTLREAVAT
ncbi:MAG TPA: G/U mismatch-specific DNA glycosylase [Gemmatimonadaceae bacterium]|nr:G/U mismatch-specific DNA glycosylase [Gemmatimonadaceae bacterium]